MSHELRYTVRQIVTKVGPKRLCKMLGIGKWAYAKWYDLGIPGRHWAKLVAWSKTQDEHWLTYEVLEDATAIALRRYRRAA